MGSLQAFALLLALCLLPAGCSEMQGETAVVRKTVRLRKEIADTNLEKCEKECQNIRSEENVAIKEKRPYDR